MKLDLSNMLKTQEAPFKTLDEAKNRVAKYLLSFIHIELEGLPREEWDKTLKTWEKICEFSKSLVRLPEEKRKEIYRKFNFDTMMEGVCEEVVKTLYGFYSLGIMKPQEPAKNVIRKSVQLIEGNKEIYEREKFKDEIINYIKEFFEK